MIQASVLEEVKMWWAEQYPLSQADLWAMILLANEPVRLTQVAPILEGLE